MRRVSLAAGLFLCLAHIVGGQSAAPAPAFDSADIHLRGRTSNPNPVMSGGILRAGRYDLRNATMVNLITTAYGVQPDSVLGGPNWLERDRFDIIARAPQSTSDERLQLMLQQLLSDRFKLAIKKETRPMPRQALIVGEGGHKMKKSTGDGSGYCEPLPPPAPEPGRVSNTALSCKNVTMASWVAQVQGWGQGYFSTPAVDQTGLTDGWDFEFRFTQRTMLSLAGSDAITMADALEKQLGLKLVPREVPLPALVVTSANQRPTPNPSGVSAAAASPLPAEFDVATIKLSEPGATTPVGRLQPGGLVDFQNVPLRMLISLAWDISNDEYLAGPKFIDDTFVSMQARTSADAIGSNPLAIDIDDVRLMMRSLLIDRFKMTVHTEERPVTSYVLTANRPKLTNADAANRTQWRNGPAANMRDPRDNNPILGRLVTIRNMTMAQFAEDLPRIAPGYLGGRLVVDESKLEGYWDFTFSFSPINALRAATGGGAQPGQTGAVPVASDPSGAVSLFDALDRQLGLKLETAKRPWPVLVIDKMEPKPLDN